MTIASGDIIEQGGHRFRVNIERDDTNEFPWDRDCSTGIVSDWTTRDKRSGERVLVEDRRYKRFYDWQGTIAKAHEQGWGLGAKALAELAVKMGHEPTTGEIMEQAVQQNFDNLKAYCNEDWWYVGIAVTLLDCPQDAMQPETDCSHALWGIESNEDAYLEELAQELIGQHISELADADKVKADAAAEALAKHEELVKKAAVVRAALLGGYHSGAAISALADLAAAAGVTL